MARTRAITPSSKASPKRTGCCRCSATRLSSSSSFSRIPYLTHLPYIREQLAQTLARTHHPHLQRGDPDTRHPRHLVVAEILHVLEQKRLTLLRPQPCQRMLDLFPPGVALGRMIFRCLEQRRLVGDERPNAAAASCSGRATAIEQNAKQPSAEPFRIVTPRQRSVRPREGILQRFLRILSIAQHVERVPRVPIAITCYQLGVCLDVAAKHAGNDLAVRSTIHE